MFARLGNIAANQLRAIKIAKETLSLTPAGSTDWATLQNSLGIAWSDVPTGDKSENLMQAIAAYEKALAVFTKEADPVDWASMQANLGSAWRQLLTGNKSENLKKAITAFKAARTALSDGTHSHSEMRLAVATNLAWVQLITKDFAGALSTAGGGSEADTLFPPLQANHAHALLFLGRADEARAIYLKHRGEKVDIDGTDKTWDQAILEDFDELEKNGLVNAELSKLRER